ncbi:hypothetical protein KI387_016220, partial [Taxus chinensis]
NGYNVMDHDSGINVRNVSIGPSKSMAMTFKKRSEGFLFSIIKRLANLENVGVFLSVDVDFDGRSIQKNLCLR